MTSSATRLKADLARLRDLLAHEIRFSFSEEERGRLLDRTGDLLQKLVSLEGEFLTIGLLGGTGVGKSSLMNALAGAPVSSVSHRRPHTDHVLVYRHEEAPPVPDPPPETIPWTEISHRADAIRQVLLCDLPDYDSLLTAHREGVTAFLNNLDLLIWVTSPEKYADRRLFEFLGVVPKSRDNFIFVLNKMDLLFEGDQKDSGFPRLAAASTRFTEHLHDAGMDAPVLFCVSATEALDGKVPSPWNQFPLLRQQVFQLRDAKQVRAIKSGNLDAESRDLFSRVHEEVERLDQLAASLDRAVHGLKQDRPAWEALGRESMGPWLESRTVREAFLPARDALPLSGPGLALGLLFLRPGKGSGSEPDVDRMWQRLSPPKSVVSVLRRRLGWVEDRLVRDMLKENLPATLQDRVRETLRQEERFEEIGERLFQAASRHTSAPLLSGMPGFRLLQGLTYGFLLILLLFALGGPAAWREIALNPGWGSCLQLVSSLVRNLFHTKGLAALGSYALLNLFFGARFLLSYRKRLKRATDRAVDALARDMIRVWVGQLDAVLEDLAALEEDIRSRSHALTSLTGSRAPAPSPNSSE